MRCTRLLAALLLPAVLVALAPLPGDSAYADTIRLRSGQVLEVEAVEVLDGRFRLRMHKDGETVHVDLAFERLEPAYLLKVFDRYTDPKNAEQRLHSAQVALKFGLSKEAKRRFKQAAALNEKLLPQSEEGLLGVEKLEAAKALKKLEDRLRKGKGKKPATRIKELEAVLAKLEGLLTGPFAGVLSAVQRLRIKVLINHAKKRIKREKERLAKKAPPPKKPGDDADEDDEPERESGGVPERRTYEDDRYRDRRGPRPQPPKVPGAERPPLQGGGGGGTAGGPKGGGSTGGSSPGGGLPGGGSGGGIR